MVNCTTLPVAIIASLCCTGIRIPHKDLYNGMKDVLHSYSVRSKFQLLLRITSMIYAFCSFGSECLLLTRFLLEGTANTLSLYPTIKSSKRKNSNSRNKVRSLCMETPMALLTFMSFDRCIVFATADLVSRIP